jgi:hypothetical protein
MAGGLISHMIGSTVAPTVLPANASGTALGTLSRNAAACVRKTARDRQSDRARGVEGDATGRRRWQIVTWETAQ